MPDYTVRDALKHCAMAWLSADEGSQAGATFQNRGSSRAAPRLRASLQRKPQERGLREEFGQISPGGRRHPSVPSRR